MNAIKQRTARVVSTLAILLLWAVISLWSGEIDPSFEEKLDLIDWDEMVSSIVMIPEQVDLEALDNELILAGATRKERHKRVVLALREMTQRTQGDIRSFLGEAMRNGEVREFRPFWVTNAIAVRATKGFISELSNRTDVGIIYEDLVTPTDETYEIKDVTRRIPRVLTNVEPGVTSINADSLWRMGVTGDGILVCSLDSGVDGSHPALIDRWRGAEPGVLPQEAWFDPYNNTTFPEDNDGHGTAAMGCMAGVDHSSGDTIGVAIAAKWIAAKVYDGSNKSSSALYQALEWAIDPDGNPATINDVPDVINNSWGDMSTDCSTQFWSSIDANLVAGIVMVFSVGNRGPESQTIASPASRATTPTNAFAVGATDQSNIIAHFSARGPSGCDGAPIKPEVVAHGIDVRTAERGGGYAIYTGTSFAAPYVSGGLALLRQLCPFATPGDLMEAVMNTAVDLGDPGEDNDYGHGIPDLAAAANELLLLQERPRIVFIGSIVDDGNNGEPEAGESFGLLVYLGNLGISTDDVQATLSLTEPDPFVTIYHDFSTFGDVDSDTTISNSGNPYLVGLDPMTPGAHVMNFSLDVTADGGAYTVQLSFSLRTPFVVTMADHDVGNVRFSVSDGGRFGWDTLDQTQGSGFIFPVDDQDQLFDGALLAGYDSLHVSYSAREWPSGPVAADWQVVPGGEISISRPGVYSDQDGFSVYSDVGADNPMGIDVVQQSYAWSDSNADDFVIVELTFFNSSGSIENFYTGMFMDWNIQPFTGLPHNYAGVDTSLDIGYMWNEESQKHCGVKVITDPGLVSFDIINNQDGSYQFSRTEYWNSLSSGQIETSPYMKDFSCIVSTGPFDIPSSGSVTAAFAVIGGESLDDLPNNAVSAEEMYLELP